MRAQLLCAALGLSLAADALAARAAQIPQYVVSAVNNVDGPPVDTSRDRERKLTEPYASEGTVDCHPIEFPASTHPRLGAGFTGGPGGHMRFTLIKGYVYP